MNDAPQATAPRRTAEQIKADNSRFKKLSQPRKRVAIARDALAQLGTRLNPCHGKWVRFQDEEQFMTLPRTTQLQSVLNETETCDVCAKGALFVCLVDKANDFTIGESKIASSYDGKSIAGSRTDGYLKQLFSENQLELIEVAFEGESFAYQTGLSPTNTHQDIAHAKAFFGLFGRDKSGGSELRLKAIFENIIANNGTFKPEIQPVQKWVTPGFRG